MDSGPLSKRFPAKLLLFGEHVLLRGATALAVPVEAYGGVWKMGASQSPYYARMLELAESESLKSIQGLDFERFKRDLEAGLYFDSDIPGGYGLGSSGAFCAAVYDRYAREKTTDYTVLKAIFARMESFFHGNSSGIDPLTSYTGAGILIRHKNEVEQAIMQPWISDAPVVFLLDTQLPRRSGPLIAWFLEQMEKPAFAATLEAGYLPAHESMIRHWLQAEAEPFFKTLRQVSAFQLAHFSPMIPEHLRPLWEESLTQESLLLKICGAGGGGFMLGFARDMDAALYLAEKYPLIFPLQPKKAQENPDL